MVGEGNTSPLLTNKKQTKWLELEKQKKNGSVYLITQAT
jgi:hypothetical protein